MFEFANGFLTKVLKWLICQNLVLYNNSLPFSDQFQHLPDQNPFWLAKLVCCTFLIQQSITDKMSRLQKKRLISFWSLFLLPLVKWLKFISYVLYIHVVNDHGTTNGFQKGKCVYVCMCMWLQVLGVCL